VAASRPRCKVAAASAMKTAGASEDRAIKGVRLV
jgi:hypothetical protein